MMTADFPSAKESFKKQKKEIHNLLRIHEIVSGQNPGRRPRSVQVLHRSAIILITACWQSYLESLLEETFKNLAFFDNPERIPEVMTGIIYPKDNQLIPRIFKIRDNEGNMNLICGFDKSKWQEIPKDYAEKKLKNFSTPRPDKIDKLFKDILGLENLSEC